MVFQPSAAWRWPCKKGADSEPLPTGPLQVSKLWKAVGLGVAANPEDGFYMYEFPMCGTFVEWRPLHGGVAFRCRSGTNRQSAV